MTAQVSLHFINPLFKALDERGIDPAHIVSKAEIDIAHYQNHPQEFPLLDLCRLWASAIEYCNDPLLPLKAGKHVHPADYGLIGTLIMNCTTIGEAHSYMSRHRHLFNGGFVSRAHITGGNAIYEFIAPPDIDKELTRPIVELDFSANLTMANFITNNSHADLIAPKCVGFSFKPLAPIEDYEAIFDSDVLFEQETNCFIADVQSLALNIHAPNLDVRDLVVKQIEELKATLSQSSSFTHRLESYLRGQMPGQPSIDDAAKEFYTSKRTLKRRLQEEGKNFKEICDEVRKEYVLDMLERGYIPICEVAYQMGFSTVSAFHRAFKRWTDQTPRAYIESRRRS